MQLRKQLKPDWFTPPSSEKDQGGFAVMIKPLDSLQRLDVGSHITMRDKQTMVMDAEGVEKAWRYGVVEWKGAYNEDGDKVEWRPSLIGMVERDVLREVAWEVMFRSEMTEDQKKTS